MAVKDDRGRCTGAYGGGANDWRCLYSSPPAPSSRPPNRVNWDETGAAHIYSADLPGVKKEEIRVEIEDGRYLVIRTELDAGDAEVHGRRGSFARKFRLPGMVNTDGITTDYARGVLTVTVPRMHTRAQPVVNLIGLGPACDPVARAA
ncbi:18.8 kDa class V heat shock protein-like [Triticum dicoccoides]|uniref:18.8 kDa class V heat shock protein-like n=1 Tax=Triticum dicoccoides TaxID=85692 RepID=UPI00188ED693|nr:18.8 kDa class V heat shock protein-like [Triticum dicoccoides]